MNFASAAATDEPIEAVEVVDIVDAQVVDEGSPAPHGEPCPACGCPVEAEDRFCPACGAPHERPPPPAAAAPLDDRRYFHCNTCGADVAVDPQQRSYVCAFCDSTYVVEQPHQASGRQGPEFVIGFTVTPEQALEKFRAWLQENAWYRPGDLQQAARIEEKLKGVYLPFWGFSMLARSQWRAMIGEYWYRTETYTTTDSKGNTVTRTRQVRETEWWPLEGRHHRYYSGYLVSASKGLPQSEADRIQPFNLPALKRYEPYYLAGWLCEEYSVERADALERCQQEFRRREHQHIGAFLPGDTHRSLNVRSEFRFAASDLCLLPVYILSYRYRDKVYRFLLNGQTGRAAGDKPVSAQRIGCAIGSAIGALVGGGGLLFLLSRLLGG